MRGATLSYGLQQTPHLGSLWRQRPSSPLSGVGAARMVMDAPGVASVTAVPSGLAP